MIKYGKIVNIILYLALIYNKYMVNNYYNSITYIINIWLVCGKIINII